MKTKVLFLSAMLHTGLFGGDRVVLVIGNDAYQHARKLNAAVNDATAVGQALKKLDFKVIARTDAGEEEMLEAVTELKEAARQAESVLVYANPRIRPLMEVRAVESGETPLEEERLQQDAEALRQRLDHIGIEVLDISRSGQSVSATLAGSLREQGEKDLAPVLAQRPRPSVHGIVAIPEAGDAEPEAEADLERGHFLDGWVDRDGQSIQAWHSRENLLDPAVFAKTEARADGSLRVPLEAGEISATLRALAGGKPRICLAVDGQLVSAKLLMAANGSGQLLISGFRNAGDETATSLAWRFPLSGTYELVRLESVVVSHDGERSEHHNLMTTDPVDEFREALLDRLAHRLQQLYGSRCGAAGLGFRPDAWAEKIGDEVERIAGEIAFRPKEVDNANIVAYTAAMRAFLFRQHPEDLAPLRQRLNELFSLTYQQWELWDQIGQAGYHHLALAEPWVEWTLARITFGPVKDSTEVSMEDFGKRLRSDAKEDDPAIARIEGMLDALRKELGENNLRLVLGELTRYSFVKE